MDSMDDPRFCNCLKLQEIKILTTEFDPQCVNLLLFKTANVFLQIDSIHITFCTCTTRQEIPIEFAILLVRSNLGHRSNIDPIGKILSERSYPSSSA